MGARRSRLVRLLLVGALAAASTLVLTAEPAFAATNLVKNPGFESLAPTGLPGCWLQAGSGSNTATYRVVTPGHSGARAVAVQMTAWTSGDQTVRTQPSTGCAVPVAAGHQYGLGFWYASSTPNAVAVLYRHTAAGWSKWQDMGMLPPAPTYAHFGVLSPVIPPGTDLISWGASIYGVGTLTLDDATAVDNGVVTGTPPCTAGVECAAGSWQVLGYPSTVRAIHSVLLHNGKLLLIAGSGNSAANFAAKSFSTSVYDPVDGTFTDVPTPDDLFCAGHVQLPDGRVLVVGGTAARPTTNTETGEATGWVGLAKSWVFDPDTNRYQQTNDLSGGHWYPSATELGNGDVLAVGGVGGTELPSGTQSTTTELWSNAQQRWLPVAETVQTNRPWASYPALILMQDGRLVYTGSHLGAVPDTTGSEIYDYASGTRTDVPGLGAAKNEMTHSMSVLLPPAQDQRAMTMGGIKRLNGAEAGRLTNLIDLKKPNPQWTPGPLLPQGRLVATGVPETGTQGKAYLSAVLLPDGTVFETGGSLHLRADDVAEASMFDPNTNTFVPGMATDPVGRDYHSSATLLPDGRVVAIGSSPSNGTFEMRISMYSPPYLFHGRRPSITGVAQQEWGYGTSRRITVDSPVVKASLIRPAAVTHSSDPNQRLVDLPMSGNGTTIDLNVTTNPNLAPPGWYMLFVTDANGTPSVAQWVHVGVPVAAPLARATAASAPAPHVDVFARALEGTTLRPAAQAQVISEGANYDGCDAAYGVDVCVPVVFPPGTTDKCRWLADHGFGPLVVPGPDPQHLASCADLLGTR